MSKDAPGRLRPHDQLREARQILDTEGRALVDLATRLNEEFCRAVKLLHECSGSVIVGGMGKAGLVGQKVSATLASTGTRSHFLHPAEAFHGDLGRIHGDDVALLFSQSGETEEVVRLLPSLKDLSVRLVAVTGRPQSTLGKAAAVTLDLGRLEEACALGLAPSTTTTAMLALGDALALVTMRMRNFRPDDFARFHPGGSLGQQLSKVEDHMRPLEACRVAAESESVRDVFVQCTRPGRRSGAILLVDAEQRLSGFFTDSDLARLFETRREADLDGPISGVMTTEPTTVCEGAPFSEALEIFAQRKISELPVTSADGRPLGLIDITDVAELLPPERLPPVQSATSGNLSEPATVPLFPRRRTNRATGT